jgi:deoxyribodipyrimidine photo-lyase
LTLVRPERIKDVRTDTIGPTHEGGDGPVVYWINRDRRLHDNWAFLHAAEQGRGRPLHVAFCLVPTFLEATLRQYDFMLRGLEESERALAPYQIQFDVLLGTPQEVLLPYLDELRPSLLVTDHEPLRIKRKWVADVAKATSMPFHMVDAHNIVPVWIASDKEEFAAYTIRPKIVRQLTTYLELFPSIESLLQDRSTDASTAAVSVPTANNIQWTSLRDQLRIDRSIGPVDWITPGENAARAMLDSFIDRLPSYAQRNDPTVDGQSNLSPYLHFGQLSAQRIALKVLKAQDLTTADVASVSAIKSAAWGFHEELIVRRELSDNYTTYNDHYDSFDGLHPWAQKTLNDHRSDPRDHLYTLDEWEGARTHDTLWNAAQREMVATGKMHGYMRMYWAKKILEWSSTPEEALAIAVTLNDRYELDGRDPNGYVGVAWSIGGLHDRAWTERPVYGKIRYMNASGCRRKFDVNTYIARHASD